MSNSPCEVLIALVEDGRRVVPRSPAVLLVAAKAKVCCFSAQY